MVQPLRYSCFHLLCWGILCLMSTSKAHANTYTVTSIEDSGTGTIRQAILDANSHKGADSIAFAIPKGVLPTISLLSPLPDIIDTLLIDGLTQPNAVAFPIITLEGSGAETSDIDGLRINASGCTIRGLAINRFGRSGIAVLQGVQNTSVQGCFIGLDSDGVTSLGNTYGVWLDSSTNNQVQDCVLSGNIFGVYLTGSASNNTVQNSLVGLDFTGIDAVPNLRGIVCAGGKNNLFANNALSGNYGIGIQICNGSTQNTIQDSLIGLNLYSTAQANSGEGISLWNSSNNQIARNLIASNGSSGIQIGGGQSIGNSVIANVCANNYHGLEILEGANNNTIGDSDESSRNFFFGNTLQGIHVVDEGTTQNRIQTNDIYQNGDCGILIASPNNTLFNNRVFGNLLEGIVVGDPDGVLAVNQVSLQSNRIYDNGDIGILLLGVDDTLANSGMVPPVLNTATSDSGITTVLGTLQGIPQTSYTVQLFANLLPDDSGYGAGEYVMSAPISVTTDESGAAVLQFSTPTPPIGTWISAIATSPQGDSSQFSNAVQQNAPSSPIVHVQRAKGVGGLKTNLTAQLVRRKGGKPVPGRQVTFQIDGESIGKTKTNSKGVAELTYALPKERLGERAITVIFQGDAHYTASAGRQTLSVLQRTRIVSKETNVKVGKKVTLRARLREYYSGEPIAQKTLTFSVGDSMIGVGTTDVEGICTLILMPPKEWGVGDKAVLVRFNEESRLAESIATLTLHILP